MKSRVLLFLLLVLLTSCSQKAQEVKEEPKLPSEEELLRKELQKDFEEFLQKARSLQNR